MNRIYLIVFIICLHCTAAEGLWAQEPEGRDSVSVTVDRGPESAGIQPVSGECFRNGDFPDILPFSSDEIIPYYNERWSEIETVAGIRNFNPSFGYVPVSVTVYGFSDSAFMPLAGSFGLALGRHDLDLTGFYQMTRQEISAGIRLTDRLLLSTGMLVGMHSGLAGNAQGFANAYGVAGVVRMDARLSDRTSLGLWSAYGSPAAFGPAFGPVMSGVPGPGMTAPDTGMKRPVRIAVGAEARFKVGDNMTIGIGASVSTQSP